MNKKTFFGWVFIVVIIATTFAIQVFESFNVFFLLLLTVQLFTSVFYSRNFNDLQVAILRSLLGGLFIFSGLVKGVDPLGTQYRIEDYFIAFGMDWAIPFAFVLSIILNASEFVLGALLLFNISIRTTSFLVLLMMLFFTATTFYDALYSPVADCGCFGDFITISNWQTFYKNLIIDALLLSFYLNRKRNTLFKFKNYLQLALLMVFVSGFIMFEFYNYNHLPIWNFRDWKVGKKMLIDNPKPKLYYLKYRNKISGEEKEYLSPDYPFNDVDWMEQWEFVSQRIDDPNPRLFDLTIMDEEGFEFTSEIISLKESHFIAVIPFIDEVSVIGIRSLKKFSEDCLENGYNIVLLTSSFKEEVSNFITENKMDIPTFYSDDTELEVMIRSNPGLIWLKDGVVMDKWHYNDFPDFELLRNKL